MGTTWVPSPPPARCSPAATTPVTAATVPSPLLTASTVPTGTASPTGPSVSPPATRSAFALLTPTACGAATTLDTVPTTVSRGTCTTGTPLAGVLATPRP